MELFEYPKNAEKRCDVVYRISHPKSVNVIFYDPRIHYFSNATKVCTVSRSKGTMNYSTEYGEVREIPLKSDCLDYTLEIEAPRWTLVVKLKLQKEVRGTGKDAFYCWVLKAIPEGRGQMKITEKTYDDSL